MMAMYTVQLHMIHKALQSFQEARADAGRKMVTPWRAIFTSVPLLAICVSHCGIVYGFLTLLLETPMYLKEVHGIDMKQVPLSIAFVMEDLNTSKIE